MSETKKAKETVKNSEYDTNPPIILNKQQWQCIYNWMQEYANQQNQDLQMQLDELKQAADEYKKATIKLVEKITLH